MVNLGVNSQRLVTGIISRLSIICDNSRCFHAWLAGWLASSNSDYPRTCTSLLNSFYYRHQQYRLWAHDFIRIARFDTAILSFYQEPNSGIKLTSTALLLIKGTTLFYITKADAHVHCMASCCGTFLRKNQLLHVIIFLQL
jgi:hypothetical protein